jgi:hypothetical protein
VLAQMQRTVLDPARCRDWRHASGLRHHRTLYRWITALRSETARPPCIDRRMARGRLRNLPIDPATLKSA